jgi:hypothetical protein
MYYFQSALRTVCATLRAHRRSKITKGRCSDDLQQNSTAVDVTAGGGQPGRDDVITIAIVISLTALLLRFLTTVRRTDTTGNEYPESLTAVLEPASEEYLAWLADHHWPDDEYFEIEREFDLPQSCPQCYGVDDDIWPCRACGQLLHSACGFGMSRRRVAKPYRTPDMGSETVIAEWTCTSCSAIVALDVDVDDEETGSDAHC